MSIDLRVTTSHGEEYIQDGTFDDFGEAMRVGIQLAHELGSEPDFDPADTTEIRLYSGPKRILTIAIVRGGLDNC